jgi:hypothetical protein
VKDVKQKLFSICTLLSLAALSCTKPPGTTLVLEGGGIVLPTATGGGKFEVSAKQKFTIEWLYGANPCADSIRYTTTESESTASCTLVAGANGIFRFLATPSPATHPLPRIDPYIQIKPCKGCKTLPVKPGPISSTQVPSHADGTIAIWCGNGQTKVDPGTKPAQKGSPVTWIPIASNDWTVVVKDSQGHAACTNGSNFGSGSSLSDTCNTGQNPGSYSYEATLRSCSATPATGTLQIVP